MPDYALLISDRTEAAYFARSDDIALAEAGLCFPDCEVTLDVRGGLRFLRLEAEAARVPDLLRLSSVQGVFEVREGLLAPVERSAVFELHSDFVWGEKYRGKTNETLTQMLINVGLAQVPGARTLLDPMCGRGTSVFWALRYGLNATGVEQDVTVLAEIRRGFRKWAKLHRQKHKLSEGWIRKANKQNTGKFLEISAGSTARFVIGDTVGAHDLTLHKPFDLIVSDLPYGVQHQGKGERNPRAVLQEAAAGWAKTLAPGGAMVLAFNAYQPKRTELVDAFTAHGLVEVETDLEHRMSESILRDILVMRAP